MELRAEKRMNRHIRILPVVTLAALLAVLPAVRAAAQTDDEYRMEIGGGVGLLTYEGDLNGGLFSGMRPAGSVVLRRLLNPYMGFRLAALAGQVKGSTDKHPLPDGRQYAFSHTLASMDLTYEYNFWPYGTGRDYRGSRRVTPFVFGGLGMTYASADESVVTANVPLGLGVKCKIAPRLNLGVEWAIHFSLSDRLDGLEDPLGVESKGIFKNTDCYSALQVTLTYSFMPKCKTCNNDR